MATAQSLIVKIAAVGALTASSTAADYQTALASADTVELVANEGVAITDADDNYYSLSADNPEWQKSRRIGRGWTSGFSIKPFNFGSSSEFKRLWDFYNGDDLLAFRYAPDGDDTTSKYVFQGIIRINDFRVDGQVDASPMATLAIRGHGILRFDQRG